MSKNKIETNKNLIVQEELYDEILNGFEEEGGTSCKKTLMVLSSKQKVRVPLVAQHMFKSVEGKNFVKYWVENLTTGFDASALISSLNANLLSAFKKQEQELQEEFEEAIDGADTSMNIFKAFKLIKLLHEVANISRTIKIIREYDYSAIERAMKNIIDIEIHGQMLDDMKRLLMLNSLTQMFIDILSPVVGNIFKSIKEYYDSKEFEKLFFGVYEWMGREIAISAVLAAASFGIGGTAYASVQAVRIGKIFRDVSRITRWSRAANTMRKVWRSSRRIGAIRLRHARRAFGKSGENMYKAIKGIKYARTANAVATAFDLIDFDDEDAEKFKSRIAKFQQEKIEPMVFKVNDSLDKTRTVISETDEFIVDYAKDKIEEMFDVNQVVDDLKEVSSNFGKKTAQLEYENFDVDVNKFEGRQQQYYYNNIDDKLQLKELDDKEESNFEKLLRTKTKKMYESFNINGYRFRVDDNIFDELDEMFFCKAIKKLNYTLRTAFGNVMNSMFLFLKAINENYKNVIQSRVAEVDSITPNSYIIQIYKKQKPSKSVSISNGNVSSTKPEPEITDEKNSNEQSVWRLYRNPDDPILEPFTPILKGGVIDGFQLILSSPTNKKVTFTIDNMVKKLSRVGDRITYYRYINYFSNFDKILIDREDNTIDTQGKLNDIISPNQNVVNQNIIAYEYHIEVSTNEIVTDILNKLNPQEYS